MMPMVVCLCSLQTDVPCSRPPSLPPLRVFNLQGRLLAVPSYGLAMLPRGLGLNDCFA